MKRLSIFVLCVLLAVSANAQDGTVKELKKEAEKVIAKDPADTVPRTWRLGGVCNVNVNQGSLSNWAAGGDKFSFSLNSYLNLHALYKKGRNSWDNNLDLAYGLVKTTSLGNRKAADRIDFLSKYGYGISKKVSIATLLNFRSQFAKGFSYAKNVAGLDSSTLTSKTFSPAYLLVSLGLDYKPNADLSIFVSPITARWVIVSDTYFSSFYGLEPGETVKTEVGAYLSTNYLKKLGNNFTFKTRLDLFSNYLDEPKNIDIFWTNVLTAKITRYINFSLNVDMIYDDDTRNVDPTKGPAPQWLQLMGIGFSYTFNQK